MYITLFKNRIYMNGTEYYCFICNMKLMNEQNAVAHTSDEVNHLQQMKNAAPFRNIKIDEELCIKLVENGIVIIYNKEYKCTICSCSIPNIDHVSEHINGKKHTTKHRKLLDCTINNVNLNEFNDQENTIKSVLPNGEQMDKSESCPNNGQIGISIYSNQVDKNYSEKINFQNYSYIGVGEKKKDSSSASSSRKEVPFQENSFHNQVPVINSDLIYCSSCHNYLEPNSAIRYHRMFHLSQKNCNAYDIISFSIRKNNKSIYCLICDCVMKAENDLENHLIENRHLKRSILFYYITDNTLANIMYRNCLNAAVPQNMNNIYNILEYNKYLQYMNYHLYQTASSAVVQSSPMNYKFNQQSIMNSNFPITHNQNMQVPLNYSAFPLFFCFVCVVEFVDENLLYYHYTYDYCHKYRMEVVNILLKDKNIQFATFSNDEFIVCTKCQIQMTNANEAITHIFELQHAMQNPIEHKKTIINDRAILENSNVYVCPICKVNLTDDCLMIQHIESECHKRNIQEYYININSTTFKKIIFSCPRCNMNFFNDNTFLEHLYVVHEKHFNITANTLMNKSYQSNNKLVAVTETCQSDNPMLLHNVDHTLNNFVNLNLNKDSNIQSLKFNLNKNNGNHEENKNDKSSAAIHTKNLINFSQRYVKLCVESGKENIFRISPERLELLELGIYLTFPYKSGRGCIPCGCEVSNDPQLLYEHLRTEKHEQNLLEMEENNEFFENYDDQFSDLKLAKQYMYEDSDEWVKCFACDINVENCDRNLYNHINSEFHTNNCQPWINSANDIFQIFNNMFKNLWYYIEKFFCNICCNHFIFEVDYARHLESPQHLKEVESRILKKQNLQFDYCIICSYFWYARSDQYKIHCNKDSHKYILKSRDFTVPNMPDSAKTILTSVEKTVNDLILESNEISATDGDVEKQLLESVEEVVKFKYPKAKAYLFGSRISHLGIKDSDLDIYLDCKNQYEKLSSINECQEQLLVVQECFHKYQDIWIIEEIVLRTRVPIIKIRHRPTNLNCDISFINGLSVEKSKILSYFTKACLPCRKMILYLKIWNNLCGLSGKKGITTFAISWLVIFYLQLQGFLPSVWNLIKLENQSNIIAGWETGISKIIPVKEIDLTTKDLLKGFFSYYANFDYISSVACPYLGQVMKKSQFSHIDNLPDEMDLYKLKIKEEVDFFRLDSPMCIQEPIDLSQNLTKAVTKLHLRMFKQYCSESAAILQSNTSD
ncbi:uncharacterized protein LOC131668334 [Phymastichus coffea]|uniref:uncharacterized protein LOC131668334 n=1 Tax=Phymastichus coffea TaxID=108790 RepID=UPI00273C4499|nr:uncharacterized protein LOC131668334 [Phymastichus coffea]